MMLLEGLQNGADSTTEEQAGSDIWMQYVLTMLRVMVKAFMGECLTAEQTSEQVVERDRRTVRVPPRCGFDH